MQRITRNTATRDKHRAMIARGQPPCHICGHPIDYTLKYPDQSCYVVDHVVPLETGGTDTIDNKRAAHRSCNSKKAAKPFADVIRRSGALSRGV